MPILRRSHESLNLPLLLFVATKQIYKVKSPFIKHTLALEAQEHINQQVIVIKDS